jgi:uncharacterized membrane protein YfcA
VGCPTHVAIGTDLFEIMISSFYGTATYSYKGRTEPYAALIMLMGAAVGAQIGTVATKYVRGYGIRKAFGYAVVGCAVSVGLKLFPMYYPYAEKFCDIAATVVVLGVVSALSLYITFRMIIGARREINAKAKKQKIHRRDAEGAEKTLTTKDTKSTKRKKTNNLERDKQT